MTTLRAQQRKGVVLIVVLGILVVLALLATTFATLQRIDRTVSRNYMDDVRAKLLAQSGVDYAITQIRSMMSQGMFNSASGGVPWWQYWGNDVNETGTNPALLQVPIETAKNPSWALETTANPTDPTGMPRQINIKRPDGSTIGVGCSGLMDSGTYCPNGDIYTLKCTDTSGMIYVNDGVYQYGGNTSTVSVNLQRVLNNLGKHPLIGVPNLGNLIISNRPPAGYTSKYELRKAVAYDDMKFNKFKDYVTTHAWVDKNVVNPVPLSDAMLPNYTSVGPSYYRGSNPMNIGRRGRGMNDSGSPRNVAEPLMWYSPSVSDYNHNAVYGHDELFPSYIEVVWRAPVNVNNAKEPVLAALVSDVSGFFMIERRRFTPYANSAPNFVYNGSIFGFPIPANIPQNYYTWWYTRHTYDNQRWTGLIPAGSGSGVGSMAGDSTALEGDEIGNLYQTIPFVGPGGSATGISAITIAQAIIQCRSNTGIYAGKPFAGPFKSWPQFNAFLDFLVQQGVIADTRPIFWDYGPWPGSLGPQTRMMAAPGGPNNLYASQAAADALKANFNPNCHLNCTNPDRNLFTLVDKISLIANTTELCFTPMGYYEIESLGRVLRPMEDTSGTTTSVDAFTSGGNFVVAEKKMIVEVKIFDAYRESTQRHFYGGTLYPRQQSGVYNVTNNNCSLEIGPEVDNGPLVYNDTWKGFTQTMTPVWDGYAGYAPGTSTQAQGWGYEYEGYIHLPTLGGNWNAADMSSVKPKGTLWTTQPGTASLGSDVIEVHFTYDFKARYHASASILGDQFRDVVTHNPGLTAGLYIDVLLYTVPPKRSRTANWPDVDQGASQRPYGPVDDPQHRLARSFRMPLQPSGSGSGSLTPPNLSSSFAPSDLRIDGGYSERNDGLAYWMDNAVSYDDQNGMYAFWIKPSFYPEHSGKPRKVLGMARWHLQQFPYRNPVPWDIFYFPAQDNGPGLPSSTEYMPAAYVGNPSGSADSVPIESVGAQGVYPFRPMSLNSIWNMTCYGGGGGDFNDWAPWFEEENYACTPSLNHRLHPGESGLPNLLDKGQWTHVIFWWHEDIQPSITYNSAHLHTLLVDGTMPSVPTIENQLYAGQLYCSDGRHRYYSIQSWADFSDPSHWLTNTIRLGECSTHGFGPYDRNYSGDFTFDEFYSFKDHSTSLAYAQLLWSAGRYYKPLWNNYSDSAFLSASINLSTLAPPRYLPPPSTTATPPTTTGSSSSSVSSTTTGPAAATKRRLWGVTWSWIAEAYAPISAGPGQMVPIMYDYMNPNAPAPLYQTDTGAVTGKPVACCRVFVIADGTQFPLSQPGGYTDNGWSAIVDSTGKPYAVTDPTNIKYKVWFQIKGIETNSALLQSPIFDDITLFYDSGDVKFLLFAMVNTV